MSAFIFWPDCAATYKRNGNKGDCDKISSLVVTSLEDRGFGHFHVRFFLGNALHHHK